MRGSCFWGLVSRTLAVVVVFAAAGAGCRDGSREERPGEPGLLEMPELALVWTLTLEGTFEELFTVRDATVLSDGSIIMSDSRGGAVWRLRPGAGKPELVGRRGQGPGEFIYPSSVWGLDGGGFEVWDAGQGRITTFDSSGAVAATWPVEASLSGFTEFCSPVKPGTWLVGIRSLPPPATLGLMGRDTVTLRIMSGAGFASSHVIRLPYYLLAGHPGRGGVASGVVKFSSVPQWVTTDTSVLISQLAGAEIIEYALDGTELRSVSWRTPARRVQQDDISRQESIWLAQAPEERRTQVRNALPSVIYPEEFPVLSSIHRDPAGWLWAVGYHTSWEASSRWWVFDETMDPVGSFLGPPLDEVFEVGQDYVLGVRTDDLGVSTLVRFGFNRPLR
ncbi:MAG: hypothetical protein Q8P50_12580 [Bacillota bacterium]|nr:hypothetical protein [Bacillota bacterium]